MIKKIALGLLALVVAVLLFAATLPNPFHLESSILVQASPQQIFPLINDLKAWPQWSPYEGLDPQMKKTYSEPPVGPGATYDWEGNGEVGKGQVRIVAADQPTRVQLALKMERPFEALNDVVFTLVPEGDSTKVTWAMSGPRPYFFKLIGLLFSDSMVRKQFMQGLTKLKITAEMYHRMELRAKSGH